MKYIAHRSHNIDSFVIPFLHALFEEREMVISREFAQLHFFYTLEATFLTKGSVLLKCAPL